MFSLETPHRDDCNEYTRYTIFNKQKKKKLKLSQIFSCWNFSNGLKNEFETAVINDPSVFKPLKFYCLLQYETFLHGANKEVKVVICG